MNIQHTLRTFAIVILGAALFAACSKQEQKTATDSTLTRDTIAHATVKEGQGKGILRAMDTVAKTVTLDHNDIPNIMDAMTMDYHVDKPELLRGMKTGDSVVFTLQDRGEGDFVVTQITSLSKH